MEKKKRIPLAVADFGPLKELFLGPKMQFRTIFGFETKQTLTRLGAIAPKKVTGSETGFSFEANNYKVVVWSSFVESENDWRKKDVARVLIVENDDIKYCSRDIRQTRFLPIRLARTAWIARWKVLHRPCCPECGGYMNIVNRKFRRYWWECLKKEAHSSGKKVTLPWDHGLPPKALAYVEKMRKPGDKYRRKRKKEGKPTQVVQKRRVGKGWQYKNKHNKS